MGETLWLVKLPEFLGEFTASREHDEVIGKLKVRKTAPTKEHPKGGKSTTVELIDTGRNEGIPSEYSLDEKSAGDNVSMLAFSEQYNNDSSSAKSGKSTRSGYILHGSVTKNMILRPEGAEYTKLLRERSMKAYMRREVKTDSNAIQNFNAMNHIVHFKPGDAAIMKMKAMEADRANRNLGDDDGAGMNALKLKVFEAFSKAERIKQADLHAYCGDCPGYTSARVKEILEGCAKYHQKGPFKYFWELNPEYRGQKVEPK